MPMGILVVTKFVCACMYFRILVCFAKSGLVTRFFTSAVLQCIQNHGLCCSGLPCKAAYRIDTIQNYLIVMVTLVPPF